MEPVIIILISMLVLGLLGVGQVIREQNKKRNQLALSLAYQGMVEKHKLQIEHVEVFEDRIIGLDRKQKVLVFLFHRSGCFSELTVPLLELTGCRIVEKHNEKGYITNVSIHMETLIKDKVYQLCFYDDQFDKPTSLLPAMRRARNWKQRIAVNSDPGVISLEAEYVL
ncbi:hypothetical protein [Flavisolibacter tropicus]|uniref:Uncharacterized protein n=1 Tax=Flavisolibacter tropicus TaxID=1492898 RepID=A0A172TV59_9BACT|nr:hypothetical protein [Flavisolibacter tropicus]ANE50858.1 hypothetical protein SY85_10435 [Flavisolibacter tropicus]